MTESDLGHELLSKRKVKLQVRYVVYYLVALLASAVVLSVYVYHRSRLALHYEMFRGHSKLANTWDLLRPLVLSTSASVTLTLIGFASVMTLIISWVIHRASKRLAANLRDYMDHRDTAAWKPIRHPREFGHLQQMLAEGLNAHGDRIGRLRYIAQELEKRVTKVNEACEQQGTGGLDHKHLRYLHVRCERLKQAFRSLRLE